MCFVWFYNHLKIYTTLESMDVFIVPSKSLQRGQLHQDGFTWFEPFELEISNFKIFFFVKNYQNKTKKAKKRDLIWIGLL